MRGGKGVGGGGSPQYLFGFGMGEVRMVIINCKAIL